MRDRCAAQMDDGGHMLSFLCEHATSNGALARAMVSTLQHCPEFDDDRETLAVVGQSTRPVLVLWGDHDHTIPRASIDATVTLLPRARLRVFDGLRHSLLVTHPREVNAEIVAFLGPEASL